MQRKRVYGLLAFVALGCLGVIALTSQAALKKAPGFTHKVTLKQMIGSTPIYITDAHVCSNGQVRVTGNANGQVSLSDATNGNVLQTFQMDAGVPIRQVFLLDSGLTVGAAQADHTVFWNRATGNQIHSLSEEVYGFLHNQTMCIATTGSRLTVYSYPGLQSITTLQQNGTGIEGWNFSPDDHYIAVLFSAARPSSNANYPNPNSVLTNVLASELFDLTNGQSLATFQDLSLSSLGDFSADSQLYIISKGIWRNDNYTNADGSQTGSFQYQMSNGQITSL